MFALYNVGRALKLIGNMNDKKAIMTKTVTYDDTRDISIRVIEALIELGHLQDNDDHYFEIQDTIHDKINEVFGLDIDDNFEITVQ